MIRKMLFSVALLFAAQSGQAFEVDSSGIRITFPEAYVITEQKREIKSKDKFIHELVTQHTLRNSQRLEGNDRFVLMTELRYIPKIPLPATPAEKLQDEFAKAKEKYPDGTVQLLTLGEHKAILIDAPYVPSDAKPDAKKIQIATLSMVVAGARVNTNVLYSPDDIASEKVILALQAAKVDEPTVKRLISEANSIRTAAVSGNTINTQAGSFALQSGTNIQFGSLQMIRKDEGSTVMTSFFVQREGFWTSQRAGIVITCLPGGVGKPEEQDKILDTVLTAASVGKDSIQKERLKLGGWDMLKARYKMNNGTLDSTSWFIYGGKSTLVATLMGITTEKFQQQFEKSTALGQADCNKIPGSQLDPVEPAL